MNEQEPQTDNTPAKAPETADDKKIVGTSGEPKTAEVSNETQRPEKPDTAADAKPASGLDGPPSSSDDKPVDDSSQPKLETKPRPDISAFTSSGANPKLSQPTQQPSTQPQNVFSVLNKHHKAATPESLDTASNPPTGQSVDPKDMQQRQQRDRSDSQEALQNVKQWGEIGAQMHADTLNAARDVVINFPSGYGGQDIYPPPPREGALVSIQEINQIRAVYQPHAEIPKAQRWLTDYHCITLCGDLHVGKRTAAIHLAVVLAQAANREIAIWELPPDQDPVERIKSASMTSGTVFLVDGLLRERLEAFRDLQIRKAVQLLKEHGCYLIICARNQALIPTEAHPIVLKRIPHSSRILVEQHLKYYSDGERHFKAQAIEQALANPDIVELLKTEISPVLADQLAMRIADCLTRGGQIEEALRGISAVNADDAHKWIRDTANDVEESAFRISLAVFSGLPYEAILDASQTLLSKLRPKLAPSKTKTTEPEYVSPLKRMARRERLESANAELVKRKIHTNYNESSLIEVVELKESSFSSLAIKYIWNEVDEWRQPLLEWLCEYALTGTSRMRLKAAGAIGALASVEFDFIQREVLSRWAGITNDDSDSRRRRFQAIGNALAVTIWDDQHAEDVLGMLRFWTESKYDSYRWAAARAYIQVGLRYPNEAINQWRVILESTDQHITIELSDEFRLMVTHPLLSSVVDAISELFIQAVDFPKRLQPIYEQALAGLASWVSEDSKDKHTKQVGLPLFLAFTQIGYPPEDGAGDPDDWPPAMLYIVGIQADSAYKSLLAAMLRRALMQRVPAITQLAILSLELWTECVDKDSRLRDVLTVLIKEVLSGGSVPVAARTRLRSLLRVHLMRWARHPLHPSLTAQQILNTLGLNAY